MTNIEQYAALKLFEERVGLIIGGIALLGYIALMIWASIPSHPRKRDNKKSKKVGK